MVLGAGRIRCCCGAMIDRIDVDPGGGRALVRDYKSGANAIKRAGARWSTERELQVGLYMIAVRRLLGLDPVAGFFQPLTGRDLRPRGAYLEGLRLSSHAYATDAFERPALDRPARRGGARRGHDRVDDASRRADSLSCDLLTGRMPSPGDLLGGMTVAFTPEQTAAIERDQGDLLLDASAGSGKTSVLVERFVRAVLHDGVDVGAILAITFTEKAAAELRERIRARLRALGADQAARATEAAPISTIHGFCARVLRANALAAGLDPAFTVLDEHEAARLALDAFDAALDQIAVRPHGAELIAAHGPAALRRAIVRTHGQLRSRGQERPRLPPLAAALGDAAVLDRQLAAARLRALGAAQVAARDLAGAGDPPARVEQALDALARACELLAGEVSWPGELEGGHAPGGDRRHGAGE